MDVDLTQLPIPDWDLRCPQCNYPLRGLPSHRCPECGSEIDIPALIATWTRLRPPRYTGQELPLPDFGLTCAGCRAELAGATSHACPHCGRPFDPAALVPPREWFILDEAMCAPLLVPAVQILLLEERIPHVVVEEKSLREIYGGHQLTFTRLRVPSEFYCEVLWQLQRARHEAAAARTAGDTQDWTCPHCGESNPGHFELCWNCERPHAPPPERTSE
ncbi:MAG: hypothetical protein PVJ57_13885 [Phycisphaerae bacterium]